MENWRQLDVLAVATAVALVLNIAVVALNVMPHEEAVYAVLYIALTAGSGGFVVGYYCALRKIYQTLRKDGTKNVDDERPQRVDI